MEMEYWEDDIWGRWMSKQQALDLLAGFLFGIGFGMIIGSELLWYTKDIE